MERLTADVVSSGLCARCGTCVAVCPEGCLSVSVDLTPIYADGCTACGTCVDSCPGRELPMAELEASFLGRTRSAGAELGAYRAALAAHAVDEQIRGAGTSGGVVTALLAGLLEAGTITGAVVTGFDPDRAYRPVSLIARDVASVRAAAQSKYALTPQVAALTDARPDDRLAFVGLPCQVAGLRKASLTEGHGRPEVVLTLGLFCLSGFYPEATTFIIEEVLGLSLADVVRVAYREGPFPGAFSVTTTCGRRHDLPYPEARAHFRMYRPYRCITCYDWSSELADLSVGDLFGDPDRDAYCSVLVRTEVGERALADMVSAGHVHVEEGDPEAIARNPGFIYKKRGNGTFIADARAHGLPTPTYPEQGTGRPSTGVPEHTDDKGESCMTC